MYLKCNIVACQRNHCCSDNATMFFVFVVEVLVIVNNIKVLSVAQQSSYGKFISPETLKRALVFM